MAFTPREDGDATPLPKKFGSELRLEALLSKEFLVETKNREESNLLDRWRMQKGKLMHELTSIGLCKEGTWPSDRSSVARFHDRQQLVEMLLNLVACNRFNPSFGDEILIDRDAVENACNIRLGEMFWRMREPFSEYWQGRYRRDQARFEVMRQTIEDIHIQPGEGRLEDHAWQWVEQYFLGCCPQEIEVPEDQNPEEVVTAFHHDVKLLEGLPLSDEDYAEALRILTLDFVGGEYPIVLGNVDDDSEETLLRYAGDIAKAPIEEVSSGDMDHRAIAISEVFRRYRVAVAQGLNFESEEEKRMEEAQADHAMHMRDFERRRQDYQTEMEFLSSLTLPEYEAEDLPRMLGQIARLPSFKPCAAYREQVHAYVGWLMEHMPEETSSRDPWATVFALLMAYWQGNYHPDPLRWHVLQDVCQRIASDQSEDPRQTKNEVYKRHAQFIEGGKQDVAKQMCAQNEDRLLAAYADDRRMIREAGLDEETCNHTIAEYTHWLLGAGMAIMPDRELPADRAKLEKAIRLYVEERKILEEPVGHTNIVEMIFDHWRAISQRRAPPSVH